MPQVVDVDVLVCGCGGDSKVVCETLIHLPGSMEAGNPSLHPLPPEDPDLPAESFRLPVEDVIDWVDRHAAASYDRDNPTRGITNPKSAASHYGSPKLHSTSQRLYAKPRGLIIGLPNKLRNSGYPCQSARRQATCGRFFPKSLAQPAGNGNSVVPESEPTSPKVSCLGKVISEGERNLCRKACRRATAGAPRDPSSVSTSAPTSGGMTGFWEAVLSCCWQRRAVELVSSSRCTPTATNGKITPQGAASPAGEISETGETFLTAPAPGLGGMTRFASGRKLASWDGELELAVEDSAGLGPSLQQRGERILPGRRSVGSLADLDCDRDWESAGSASV